MNGERLPSPDKEAKAGMIITPKPDHSSSSQASALALWPAATGTSSSHPSGFFSLNERRLAELSESTVRFPSKSAKTLQQKDGYLQKKDVAGIITQASRFRTLFSPYTAREAIQALPSSLSWVPRIWNWVTLARSLSEQDLREKQGSFIFQLINDQAIVSCRTQARNARKSGNSYTDLCGCG